MDIILQGEILPRINFSGQISSQRIPTKLFWTILRKLTKFFRHKIYPLRNLFAMKPPPPGWGIQNKAVCILFIMCTVL